VRVLPALAPLVAKCIQRRMADGQRDCLNLIVCENLKDAAATFRGMVESCLSPEEQIYAKAHVGFIDTVIGRMVPPPTAEARARNVTEILVEPYKELPVDRAGFAGELPSVVAMQPAENFAVYTARKLYIHNCGHAVLAYLGFQHGYEYGYEALVDEKIRPILETALHEAQTGIVYRYGVPLEWLQEHTRDLLHRFANRALGDTIFRLGRDPMRKLAPTDRLVGAARLADKAGVLPNALAWGIAAGYCFDAPGDAMAMELQKRIETQGFEKTLTQVSGIQPGEPLAELVSQRYHVLREKRG
jgi:mannitol-1-phosphate 5-dehydrogenase